MEKLRVKERNFLLDFDMPLVLEEKNRNSMKRNKNTLFFLPLPLHLSCPLFYSTDKHTNLPS